MGVPIDGQIRAIISCMTIKSLDFCYVMPKSLLDTNCNTLYYLFITREEGGAGSCPNAWFLTCASRLRCVVDNCGPCASTAYSKVHSVNLR